MRTGWTLGLALLVGCQGKETSDSSAGTTTDAIEDDDGDGYASEESGGDDCNDADSSIHPGADECRYDRIDNDCDDTTPDAPDTSAPVVTLVTCRDGDPMEWEPGVWTPTLLFTVQGADPDGDLFEFGLQLHVDQEVDGSVSTADSSFGLLTLPIGIEGCDGRSEVTVRTNVGVGGEEVPHDTELEWAFVLTDAAGRESDPFVLACRTPAAEDGGD